jgi:hypothetical protein
MQRKNTFWIIALIIIITSLVYFKSLINPFVFDDALVIVKNDFVKSWKNFPLLFTRSYLTSAEDVIYLGLHNIGAGEISYRPLVTASYFLDYAFWKLNPFGYHLTNLLLHIINVLLVYYSIFFISESKRVALLTSLFFALHPVNVETVAVVSHREDLLAFLFFLGAFLLFIKSDYYIGRKKAFCYSLSLLSFLLALFSKEMSVTLPLVLILYDYFFTSQKKKEKIFKQIIVRYGAYILVLLFYCWVRFFFLVGAHDFQLRYPGGNFYTNILLMSKVFAGYIQWFLFPVNIHLVLPGDPEFIPHSFFNPQVFLSVTLLISLFVIAVKMKKSSKVVSFAIFWFFVTLLPVFNILPIRNYMASRYLYFPVVGFCFLMAVFIVKLPGLKIAAIPKNIFQRAAGDLIIILLVLYCIFTLVRQFAWQDDLILWSEMVEIYPKSSMAHHNLANALRSIDLFDEAIEEYNIAIRLEPVYAKNYNFLGLCYYSKGMFEQAVKEFGKAIELNPKLTDAYINLGIVFGDKDLYKEAVSYFEQATKIDPKQPQAYVNLGVSYARMKNWAKARQALGKALEISPGLKDAQDNLEKIKKLGY